MDWNKSPLKILAKVAVGVLRDSRKFSGHPYMGTSQCNLCSSSAFLFTGGMHFLSRNQQHLSSERLMDVSFYRWQDARPATKPRVSTHWRHKRSKRHYLLRLSSSRSEHNTGRRVVSIWHDCWQYLSDHSSQHPVCPNLLSVCLAMSSLVVRPSSCHLLVSILRPDWLVWLLGDINQQ